MTSSRQISTPSQLGKVKRSEKQIETEILAFLRFSGIFAFKVENQGTFDQKIQKYRFSSRKLKGIADILGLMPNGQMLAIEVKSATGRISPHQVEFLRNVKLNNGIAIIARSVEDVEKLLVSLKFKRY